MTGKYYASVSLTRNTQAKAEDINTRTESIQSGFDKLPDPHANAPTTKGFSEPFIVDPGTINTHPPTIKQIQDQDATYAVSTGATNTYAAAMDPAFTAYTEGMSVRVKINTFNNGPSTMNINSLGAKNIVTFSGSNLVGGELQTGTIANLTYDGSDFQLDSRTVTNAALLDEDDMASNSNVAAASQQSLKAYTEGVRLSQYGGDLVAAIAAISTTETTLTINTPPDTLLAPLTTLITTSIIWHQGCDVTLGAFDLTINGSLDAGDYKLFDYNSTGVVAFARSKTVKAAWWGFANGASGAVNAAAIQAAIESKPASTGIKVLLHGGGFAVAPGVIDLGGLASVTLEGLSSAYGYGASTSAMTTLTFSAGIVGINVYKAADNTTEFCHIRNMRISGAGVCDYGIKAKGTSHVLEGITVSAFTEAGIWLADVVNSFVLNQVTSSYNTGGTGYGLLVGGDTAVTVFSVVNSNFRQNTVGIRITNAETASFTDVVSESNSSYGMELYKPTGIPLNRVTCDNLWLENNNNASDGAQLLMLGQTISAGPVSTTFTNCKFNVTNDQKGILVTSGTHTKFDRCDFLGASAATLLAEDMIVLGANAYSTTIIDGNGGGAITDNGQRTQTIDTKTAGSAGINFSGDVFKTGGRNLIYWFYNKAALSASATTYMSTIWQMDATLAGQVATYPVPGNGSVVGMVIYPSNSIDAGTITYSVSVRNAWTGARTSLSPATDVAMTNVDGTYKTHDFTQEAQVLLANGNYNVEVRMVTSADYVNTTDDYAILGLIIEF